PQHSREGGPPAPHASSSVAAAAVPPPNEPVGRTPAGTQAPPTKPVGVEESLPDSVFEQAERTGQEEAIAYERRMEHWREYAAKRRRLGGYDDGGVPAVSSLTCSKDFPTPDSRTVSMIAQALHVALADALKAQKSAAASDAKKSGGIPLRAVEETFYNRWNIPLSLNMLGFDSVLSFIKTFDQAFEIVEVTAYSGVKFVKPLDEPEFSYKDYVVLRDVDPTSSAMSVDTVAADADSPMTPVERSPETGNTEETPAEAPAAAGSGRGSKPRRGKRKAGDSAAKTQLVNLLQLIKSLQSQQVNQAKILNQMEAVAVAHENASQQQTKGVASPLHQVIQVMSDTHRHQGEHLTRLYGLVEGQLAADSS
ncbi:hypothetical protein FOZ62_014371, partial [Perkinsus olseni]